MITVILLAAGKGERTELTDNKIKYLIGDKPVFIHAYETFLNLGFDVVTVVNENDLKDISRYIQTKLVVGGKTRSESVYNGLKEITSKYVFIHDAARPFINARVILKLKEMIQSYDAAMVCKKVTSTIYSNDLKRLDRKKLIEAETPQAFLTSKLLKAYETFKEFNFTDDISLYQKMYQNDKIGLLFHETNNIKITNKADVEKYFMPTFKIGHAYDIHELTSNRNLILGGIKIDYPLGLMGHSDADVLLHAIGEALLGALGLGDLGTHFPDTNMKYKNLDSKEIILYAKDKLNEHGYIIENIDASIYAERPKLAPYILKIRENIANLLSIDVKNINVKAGTNEGMDAVGQGKAIASEATCLIKGYKR